MNVNPAKRDFYHILATHLPASGHVSPKAWPPLAHYALAILLSLIGVGTRLLLNPAVGNDALLLLSIIAVTVSAWYGGFGPGMVATVISLVGGFAILGATPPDDVEPTLASVEYARLLLFFLTGCIVSGLIEALFRAASRWRRAEQEKENRVLEERNRLAREIHDTLAQGLTGIIIQLEAAEDFLEEPDARAEARDHLVRARELARSSLTEARRSVQALRPPPREGGDLVGFLSRRIETMTAGSGVTANVQVQGSPYVFSLEREEELARIAMEAVTNALKHAHARTITVSLLFEAEQFVLTVRDDGRGFRVAGGSPSGFGLVGMSERTERIGGHLTIFSQTEKGEAASGTEVKVVVPKSVSTAVLNAPISQPAPKRPSLFRRRIGLG